jgi:mannonate dehydratase
MRRREWIGSMVAAGAALLAQRDAKSQQIAASAARGMRAPRIKDIKVITTAPQGSRLCVVKITTDQDGLHGYGCATFTQRADLVVPAVEKYLKPLLVGRATDRIEDTWQLCYDSSYWKNGPVLNSAISGVDQALWDIKGRQANMPVYELLGGKCREAAACYSHASGNEIAETIESAKKIMAQGFTHVRVQVAVPGMTGYGAAGGTSARIPSLHDAPVFEREGYIRRALQLFEACRHELGDEVELIHDAHERVTPNEAVQFAKDVEKFRLFYLEDPLSPEDIAYFRNIRQQCTTNIAMGELFNNPHEWVPLATERLIDFIRIHVSEAGGLTPCRKVAALCEIMGVRTAWHGPGDVSPVGHCANLALDLACYNFGVQEYSGFNAAAQEVFKGCPVLKDGYLYANEAPGWGMEVDEVAAAKYPFERTSALNGGWGELRLPDGTVIKQ